MQPIRTAAIITAKIIIEPIKSQPLYLKLSKKAKELNALGMTADSIARAVGVA